MSRFAHMIAGPLDATAASVRYSGPPSDRMSGRPGRQGAQAAAQPAQPPRPSIPTSPPRPQPPAKATRPAISASTEQRAQAYLDGHDLVDRAVSAGVINGDNATRATYRAAYEKDPAGTRAFLSQLGLRDAAEPNDNDYPDAYLTPGEHQRVAAAREGKRSRIHNAQD